jgi:serine/threonine-protein kinase
MDLTAGSVVAQRYQLDRLVGEGGMGVVWAATHLLTRKVVALKFLKGASPEHTKRFLREARIAGMLGHPNIVEVHDVLELPDDDGTPTMVMELLAGEALEARLRRGPLSLDELIPLMLPVVSAVGSAHARGVVHRDLKPDNIFLSTNAMGATQVKVLDFGIAKLTATEGDAASTSGLTQTGAVMGTPYYMAPEQVFGEKSVDQRVDVWAIGVILYECLSGHRPIEGDNFGQIFKNIAMGDIVPLASRVPGLPPEVADLVGRMLSRDPGQRPIDLREVFAVLSRYAAVSAQTFGPRGLC